MEEFLAQLASEQAAPAGGAATALMAGVGASLLAMCCRLTLGRARYAAHEVEVVAVLALSDEAQRSAVALCADDADAWTAVMDAQAALRGPGPAPTGTADRFQSSMKDATEVPLAVLALVGQLAQGFATVEGKLNPKVRSDLRVGAIAACAAMEGAALNVAENLSQLGDSAYALSIQAEADRIVAGALPVLRRIAEGSDGAVGDTRTIR